jgi:hypothetical protein
VSVLDSSARELDRVEGTGDESDHQESRLTPLNPGQHCDWPAGILRRDEDMTEEFKLDPRRPGMGIFHVDMYKPGDNIDLHDQPIAVGQSVTLHSGPVYVLVNVTEINGKSFKGEITGFENIDAFEFCGRKPGDTIEFTEADIHGMVH